MAGTSVACKHQLSMHASVGVQHPNREGLCQHKGGSQDAASFDRGVYADNGRNIGEILSKPH